MVGDMRGELHQSFCRNLGAKCDLTDVSIKNQVHILPIAYEPNLFFLFPLFLSWLTACFDRFGKSCPETAPIQETCQYGIPSLARSTPGGSFDQQDDRGYRFQRRLRSRLRHILSINEHPPLSSKN